MNALPDLVIHADWGTAPVKRWAATATREADHYRLTPPTPAVDPIADALRLQRPALVGFDFPIGIPLAYARKVGVAAFLDLLPELGWGEWRDFFERAATPEEISLRRPFYPRRPGGTSQRHLLDALGFESMNELRRRCELAHCKRRAAEVLFWTLGPKQVGAAAIAGWREMLIPTVREIQIWPFHGGLPELLDRGGVVICETYPSEFYGHFGLPPEKTPAARAHAAPLLLQAVRQLDVVIDPLREADIRRGFASDDAYDAFVGLLGMLNVVLGNRAAAPDLDRETREVEGWILGQA